MRPHAVGDDEEVASLLESVATPGEKNAVMILIVRSFDADVGQRAMDDLIGPLHVLTPSSTVGKQPGDVSARRSMFASSRIVELRSLDVVLGDSVQPDDGRKSARMTFAPFERDYSVSFFGRVAGIHHSPRVRRSKGEFLIAISARSIALSQSPSERRALLGNSGRRVDGGVSSSLERTGADGSRSATIGLATVDRWVSFEIDSWAPSPLESMPRTNRIGAVSGGVSSPSIVCFETFCLTTTIDRSTDFGSFERIVARPIPFTSVGSITVSRSTFW
jgi:hypothetical protein